MKLKRAVLAAISALVIAAPAGAVTADWPNVLWIIGEDMGPDWGCYGVPEARTPILDRLAAEGVRFTHAFTVTPVCSSSRSAFMTGMYATTIGAHNHRSHRDDDYRLPDGVRALTDWLRPAGYFTANVVHITDDTEERFLRGTGKTDWNFHYEGKAFDSNRWSDLRARQPFYAQINFSESHRGRDWDAAHRRIPRPADPEKVSIPPYYPDHPLVRRVWAQYLNAVMAFDRKVGLVLEKLEEDGLADSTVVFVFGDHGRAMVRAKQWPYDSGLRVPLVIRWPSGLAAPEGYAGAGAVDDRLVASIDWAATTLALAGVEKPPAMQGRVFLGPHREPPREYVFGGRDRGDETVFRTRTVRDRRWRYIRNFMPERPFLSTNRYKEFSYPELRLMRKFHAEGALTPVQETLFAPRRPAEELYDLENDPHEVRNLAVAPEHREVLVRLRGELERWIEESGDRGRVPEPPEVIRHWEEHARKSYGERLKRQAEYEAEHGIQPETAPRYGG